MRPLSLVMAIAVLLNGCAGFLRAPGNNVAPPSDSTSQVHLIDLSPAVLRDLSRSDTSSVPHELLTGKRDSYRVGPFDVVVVTVWEHPELTTPLGAFRTDLAAGQLIDADGTLYFPYMGGRVQVAGLTIPEVQNLVTASLSKVLRDPQIDIKVVGYRSQRVFLAGEVRNPGVYPVDDVPLSLPEILHRAGGITTLGDGSNVQLIRTNRTYTIDFTGLQKRGVTLDSLILQPGDQIRVPNSEERKAYLLGEVGKPSSVRLVNGRLSLVQALSDAGGFNVLTANTGAVYILRAQDSASMSVYRLDASSTVALAWADQFQLRPKDLVFVDQSGMGKWNRIIAQLLPTAQLLNNASGAASNVTNTTVDIKNLNED